ncbi:Monooxygenase, FAD-binding [Lasallia pustulata]|uniref:Monooxygenase, FAD-binding n=1 Tax=Lasallia pustulata TaxID=136370 RepID=A0A1W5D302_9LECA|nr:Monooxygenase, FAD-binding [Lasallia pustulata]
MKTIIIGGGIAGLSAAIGLRRAGHDVLVVERSSFLNEVGAAIHVPPNASKILRRWGFDAERAMADVALIAKNFDARTLEPTFEKDLSYMEEKYGSPWLLCHRADLHNELKLLATQVHGEGKPVEVRLGAGVHAINPETGTVTLENTEVISADLIIAADGVHTMAADLVLGEPIPAAPTNTSAFRFLISTADLKSSAGGARKFLDYEGSMKIFIGEGGKRLVWYPCRRGQVQNFVAIYPDSSTGDGREDWNVNASTTDFLAEFDGLHPVLLEACCQAKNIKSWKLLSRKPIRTWHRSRLVLIGDAAHPMLPHQGQGGAQAIEDGQALELIFYSFPNSPSAAEVGNHLTLFERVRKDRASTMQIYSSAGQDEAAKIQAAAREYVKNGKIPTNQQEFYDWNFGYDIFSHCHDVMGAASADSEQG